MSRFYRQGKVISVFEDSVEIKLSISGFCSGEHNCALTAFTKNIPHNKNKVIVKNSIDARVGEKVIVEVISPGFYRALFFVFVLPLIALILGCALGIQIAILMGIPQKTDLYAGIFAVASFCLSLLIGRFIDRRVRPRYIVLSRIDESSNCEKCSLMLANQNLLGR